MGKPDGRLLEKVYTSYVSYFVTTEAVTFDLFH